MGFGSSHGTEDAVLVVENVMQQSIEYGSPLWIISIDLTNAFDRVEYSQLFASLSDQGVSREY